MRRQQASPSLFYIMTISFIVAMARNRVIGSEGKVPWKLPVDMKRFRMLTMGKPVVMGRKTFESIGKALPGRLNIVMTHDVSFRAIDCRVVTSHEEALNVVSGYDEVMVIGGEAIFKEFLSIANRIYLTVIDMEVGGDTFFPEIDMNQWYEVKREDHMPDERNSYRYTFVTLEKK